MVRGGGGGGGADKIMGNTRTRKEHIKVNAVKNPVCLRGRKSGRYQGRQGAKGGNN